MRIHLLFFFVLVFHLSCFSQVDGKISISAYNIQGKHYIQGSIIINNKSEQPFLCWFQKAPSNNPIKEYFSTRINDFSISELIYEGLLTEEKMMLFNSFIKIVNPYEQFEIILIDSNNLLSINYLESFRLKHLQICKIEEVINIYKFKPEFIPTFKKNIIAFNINDIEDFLD